jgi:hypothetical protein
MPLCPTAAGRAAAVSAASTPRRRTNLKHQTEGALDVIESNSSSFCILEHGAILAAITTSPRIEVKNATWIHRHIDCKASPIRKALDREWEERFEPLRDAPSK